MLWLIYWKYIVEDEVPKLTYVEDKIIISPLFLCISVIFLQRAMVHYTILKTMLLYLLKIYPSLCISAGNEGIVLAIFSTFSQNSSEINLKDDNTPMLFTVTCNIFQLCKPGITLFNLRYVQNQFYRL